MVFEPVAKVLIDNATISSVQRALGKASLRDPTLIDLEQVALARFCEAVLLNDTVIIPDNYKPQLTPGRKRLIAGDAFSFEPLDEGEDDAIGAATSALGPIWNEAFRAGYDRSLFSKYFAQVNAFSNFVWENSSSQLFLVFRAHGIDKENPLIGAFLASQPNPDLGKNLEILDRNDQPIPWGRLSPHVQRMLSVMGWISHQYLWHQIFAAKHDLVYMPHPLRDFFAYDFLGRINRGAKSTTAFSAAFANGIGEFESTVKQSLEELGLAEMAATVALPGFLPLVVRESKNRNDFMPVLMHIRDEPEVVELRAMLGDIAENVSRGNYSPLAKVRREIETVGRNLLIERGLKERFVTITPPTTLVGVTIGGDDLSVKLRIPSVLYKQLFLSRRYRVFIKRVLEELAMPSQWADLKSKLDSWAWIEGDPFSPFYLNKDDTRSKFYNPL